MTTTTYNRALIVGICFSISAIGLTSYYHGHPLVAMSLGIAPLILYHALLVFYASDGLTQATIDSVYYFGFLVTVAALGASAIHVAITVSAKQKPDLSVVS